MTRYQLEFFLICSEVIYECSGSSNSTTKTWYLFMDCDTFIFWKSEYSSWQNWLYMYRTIYLSVKQRTYVLP